jgi:hypothetical protein
MGEDPDPAVEVLPVSFDYRVDLRGISAVVDNDQNPVLEGLRQDVTNGALKQHGPVLGPHDDRDGRQ